MSKRPGGKLGKFNIGPVSEGLPVGKQNICPWHQPYPATRRVLSTRLYACQIRALLAFIGFWWPWVTVGHAKALLRPFSPSP